MNIARPFNKPVIQQHLHGACNQHRATFTTISKIAKANRS
jgi:hypothetical protein